MIEFLSAFQTPIVAVDVPDVEALNAELSRRLLAERTRSPGVRVSNVGGWHSIADIAQRGDPVFIELRQMLVAHFRLATQELLRARGHDPPPPFGLALTSWAMIMKEGDYTTAHDHAQATWSSAYYIDAGDADTSAHPHSGTFVAMDPRRASPMTPGADLFPTTLELQPATGRLYIFPGYLQHYVHAYRGRRPRISVASNAVLRFQDAPRR